MAFRQAHTQKIKTDVLNTFLFLEGKRALKNHDPFPKNAFEQRFVKHDTCTHVRKSFMRKTFSEKKFSKLLKVWRPFLRKKVQLDVLYMLLFNGEWIEIKRKQAHPLQFITMR